MPVPPSEVQNKDSAVQAAGSSIYVSPHHHVELVDNNLQCRSERSP
ncbi:MAG: hypothetical protein U1U88_001460 [Lawsonella clevelandensis]